MLRITLKSIRSHLSRFIFTGLAIMLGVGFVMGTFVLTDTLDTAIGKAISDANQNVDVVVQGKSLDPDDTLTPRPPISAGLVATIRTVDSVAAVSGYVVDFVKILDKDGEVVGAGGWPFASAISWPSSPELQVFSFRGAGKAPETSEEIVLDAALVENEDFSVGDRIELLIDEERHSFTLTGVIGFTETDNMAGTSLAFFDLATSQKLFDREGQVDRIEVVASENLSQDELVDRLRSVLPAELEIITGEDETERTQDAISGQIAIFSNFLAVFAGISLFVGAFMIHNTFAIVVAQRNRELGLFRALGASRRQVLSSVLLESLALASIASILGIGFGVVIAALLQAAFEAIGGSLPDVAPDIRPSSVLISVSAGLLITLFSVLGPARKGAGVAPLQALREEPEATDMPPWRRTLSGFVFAFLGVTLLVAGLFVGDGSMEAVLAGGALLFLALAVLAPYAAPTLVRFIGAPIARIFGIGGSMGRTNALRNPRRTAATASAIMIAIALITTVSVIIQSLSKTVGDETEQALLANRVVSGEGQLGSISPDIAHELAGLPGVETVFPIRQEFYGTPWRLDDKLKTLVGIDPQGIDQVLDLDLKAGNLADLADGGIAVREDEAEDEGWFLGDEIPMEFSATGLQQVRIDAIFGARVLSPYLLSLVDYERNIISQTDSLILLKLSDEAAANKVTDLLSAYPDLGLLTVDEFVEDIRGSIDQLLGITSVLLGLTLIISLLGVVNTLALSIFERTREIGLLRAVGMSRRQLRSSIRWESVIITLIGAFAGVLIGLGLGIAASTAAEDGLTIAVPTGMIISFVILLTFSGMIAALLPARRAARLNPLTAIAEE